MKLVLATPLYPPDSGGPATYAKLLREHFPAKGQPFGGPGDVVLVNFAEIRHLPRGIRHFVYFLRVLGATRHADVVLALDPVSTGLPALIAACILRKPFVVKIVGDFAWEQGRQRFGITATLDQFVRQVRVPFGAACLRVVQTFVARNATRIIVPSNYLKGIITVWGIRPEKITVIYNSIEVPELSISEERHERSIISVGRLVPWKGMDGIIDAVAKVKNDIPDASLTIVGAGPDMQSLQQQGSAQLGSSITFTGALGNRETLEKIASNSIFVLNSSYEGLSHLLIEALSLGSAIIATDVGGNPELIDHEKNGLLVPFGDTPALAAAISRLLSDTELAARLRAAAKESAGRFSVPAMIDQTRMLLASAAEKGRTI